MVTPLGPWTPPARKRSPEAQGADRFTYGIYDLGNPHIFDTITDFGTGDRIDLSEIHAVYQTPFHVGRDPGTSGYAGDTGETTLRIFVDGDNGADLVIHLTGRHTDLIAADFVF